MTGESVVQLIFSVFDMLKGFAQVMFDVLSITLGDLIENTFVSGLESTDNVIYKVTSILGINDILINAISWLSRTVLGDLYNFNLITLFGSSALLIYIGLIMIKKLVPLA